MSTSQVALLASVQQFSTDSMAYILMATSRRRRVKTLNRLGPGHRPAIATTADANAADVDRAVMSAWRAFVARSWAGRTPADRERILLRFADLVEQHGESWRSSKP